MIPSHKTTACFLKSILIVLFVITPCIGSGIYVDDSTMLQHARLLAQRKEFRASAEEYYRTFVYFPKLMKDQDLVEAMFQMAVQSEDSPYALNLIDQVESADSQGYLSCIPRYYKGKLFYKMKQYNLAVQELTIEKSCVGKISENIKYIQALSFMRLGKWYESKNILGSIQSLQYPDKLQAALSLANIGQEIKYRSPKFASSLSAIFPGAGYAYSGSLKSAIAALVTTGLLSWGAYSLIHNENYAAGSMLAVLAFSWHLGGIYGSSRSAQRYNEYISDQNIGPLEIP